MRRLAAVAGLRFKYKQLEGIKSESKKYRILKDFMIEHGVTSKLLFDFNFGNSLGSGSKHFL